MRKMLRWIMLILVCGLFSAQVPLFPPSANRFDVPPVEVSVAVVDLLTRLPMPGVRVTVKGWELVGITDATGQVVLRGPKLNGWLEIRASKDGYLGMSEVRSVWLSRQSVAVSLPPMSRLHEADEWIRDPATLHPHRQQLQTQHEAPQGGTSESSTPQGGPLAAGVTYPIPKNIQVRMSDNSVVTMELEEYLKGVLPKEIGCSFPIEAQRAQAVAARTYTIDYTAGGTKPICITTQCQVWGTSRCDSTSKAVEDTRGQVAVYVGSNATYKNKLAGGYFAASCGGSTINVEDKWSFRPFLRARPCVENKGTACTVVCQPSTCGNAACPSSHATCWGVYGHRIGLCQRGAQSMAKCGKTYVEIVKHYYTDTEIANLSATTPDPKDDAKLTGEAATPNTDIYPKQKITKMWRLENTGNTTWSSKEGYALVRIGGPDLKGPASIQLNTTENIAPNQQREFSAEFLAPDQPGTYESQWQMDHKGKKFGPTLKLAVVVKAQPPTCKDEDGDGFFAPGTGCPGPYDCDDKDKTVFPGAREICGNGKDDGCRGTGDVPCPAQCVDKDKDGYFVKADGCPGPYDCDDNNKDIYPGAKEICGNGVDEDCQGGDLACPSQCVDKDGDGYFAKGEGCPEPFDCDDNNKDIYPGAKEICGNGVDEDCQGGDLSCTNPPTHPTPQKKLGERGCVKNSDCETNSCVAYRNEQICSIPCKGTGQSTCPTQYVCFQDTACWPESGTQIPLLSCTKDSDCPSGASCVTGRCTDGVRPGGSGCQCNSVSTMPSWLGLLLCLVGWIAFLSMARMRKI